MLGPISSRASAALGFSQNFSLRRWETLRWNGTVWVHFSSLFFHFGDLLFHVSRSLGKMYFFLSQTLAHYPDFWNEHKTVSFMNPPSWDRRRSVIKATKSWTKSQQRGMTGATRLDDMRAGFSTWIQNYEQEGCARRKWNMWVYVALDSSFHDLCLCCNYELQAHFSQDVLLKSIQRLFSSLLIFKSVSYLLIFPTLFVLHPCVHGLLNVFQQSLLLGNRACGWPAHMFVCLCVWVQEHVCVCVSVCVSARACVFPHCEFRRRFMKHPVCTRVCVCVFAHVCVYARSDSVLCT